MRTGAISRALSFQARVWRAVHLHAPVGQVHGALGAGREMRKVFVPRALSPGWGWPHIAGHLPAQGNVLAFPADASKRIGRVALPGSDGFARP